MCSKTLSLQFLQGYYIPGLYSLLLKAPSPSTLKAVIGMGSQSGLPSSTPWVSGCDTRSSSDIIYFCVGTIVICVWSAFHDDIPRTRPQNRRTILTIQDSIVRIVEFLLFPEILPSAALEQLREAYIISKKMKTLRHQVSFMLIK